MVKKRTHYQILGIESGVSQAEVKRAYRELVKTQHPDAHVGNGGSSKEATEEMMRLNEAYETLRDHKRRAEYDVKIGLRKGIITGSTPAFSSSDEDRLREKFLNTVFHPTRLAINKFVGAYKKELQKLAQDPYDDELIEAFQAYADSIEAALRRGSSGIASYEIPKSLEAAVHMLRNAIAQAADGLEELRYFCRSYNYDHLATAENLFRIAQDLSRQAFALSKGR